MRGRSSPFRVTPTSMGAAAAIGVLGSSVMGGCESDSASTGRYHVEVSLSPELVDRPPALLVDIVAAGGAQSDALAGYDPRAWFSGGDSRRAIADRITLTFGPGDTQPKAIRTDDGGAGEHAWKAWADAGADTLFVFVNLPKDGAVRRLDLPLDTSRWNDDTIRIQVRERGVVCTNGPGPKVPR